MARSRAAALLLGLTLLTYAGATRAAFVYDDRPVILNNSRVTQLQPLWSYWTTPELIGGQELRGFRPLTMLSFAWNHRLAGPSRAVFHLTSVALHGAMVLGLWSLCRRTLAWQPGGAGPSAELAAFSAAALFAVHPALSQAVVYLTARSSLIAASGIIWAIVCYDIYLSELHESGSGRRGWYAGALACWAAALSGKESALAGAVLFVGVEWWRARRPIDATAVRGAVRRLALPAALGVAHLAWVLGVVRAQATTPPARSWGANLVGQCAAAWEYASLLVWPRGLAIVHGADALAAGWSMQATLGVLVVAGTIATAWWCRTRRPAAAFGLAGALVTIGPESYALPLKLVVNEHRLYLPVACLALALAALLAPCLARYRRGTRLVLLLAVFAAAATTIARLRVWQSAEQVWADAAQKYPAGCRAPAHLGQLALEAGRLPQAIEHLQVATACNPIRLEPRLLLVRAHVQAADPGRAVPLAQAVVGDFPHAWEAHAELAAALAGAGRVDDAKRALRRAMTLAPANPTLQWNLEQLESGAF